MNRVYGYREFRDGQEDVINSLVDGNSTLAIFPTGAGKSMCYQVPALLFDGLTLVVSPLMALMKDQVDYLHSKGVEAAKLDSSLTLDEYREVIFKVRNNRMKILFVSPERFNNEIFRSLLGDVKISMFAIDEAHCISEWGHNFRPDYLKLAKYARTFEAERVLCLTATANEAVQNDIVSKFDIHPSSSFRRSAYRENLNLSVLSVREEDKLAKVLEIVSGKNGEATIVYVTLQKSAEAVAGYLKSGGVNAEFYHAGLESSSRESIQNKFMNAKDCVIVATIAFGMGIDKSDIRNVIHYNLPKSIEGYYQEIGRAGRDGVSSDCILFLSQGDIPALEGFAIGDFPEQDLIEKLMKELFTFDEEFTLKLGSFSNRHDIRQIVVKTILTQLELKGHLEELTPVYSSAQFKYLLEKEKVLKKFPTDKREFLGKLLDYGTHKRVWVSIDIERVEKGMEITRKKVLDVLDFLDREGLIELKMSNLINRYRFVNHSSTLSQCQNLINDICDTTQWHLEKQLSRINELVAFFTGDGCIHQSIARYFVTPLIQSCGHCSYCISGKSVKLHDSIAPHIDLNIGDVKEALSDHPHIIDSASRLSKYLLGIRSPYISRNKLSNQKYFGVLEGREWSDVQQLLS